MAGKKAASTLPAPLVGRRRALNAQQTREMLDYVAKLNREGTEMRFAKERAAQKFRCSIRTVQRLWKLRQSIPEDVPSLETILGRLIQSINLAGGWPLPLPPGR